MRVDPGNTYTMQVRRVIYRAETVAFENTYLGMVRQLQGVSHTWLKQFMRVDPGEHLHNTGKKSDLQG